MPAPVLCTHPSKTGEGVATNAPELLLLVVESATPTQLAVVLKARRMLAAALATDYAYAPTLLALLKLPKNAPQQNRISLLKSILGFGPLAVRRRDSVAAHTSSVHSSHHLEDLGVTFGKACV